MKFLKFALAAISLAVAGSANALIVNGQSPNNGELFVSIIDRDANLSYHKDLGIRFIDFLANPTMSTMDLTSDSKFQEFLNAGADLSNLKFNIAAGNANWTLDLTEFAESGVITSSNDGLDAVNFSNPNFSAIGQNVQKTQVYILGLNAAAGGTDENENLSAVSTNPAAPVGAFTTQGWHDASNWGTNLGTGVTYNTEGGVDEDLEIYFSGVSTSDFNTGVSRLLAVARLGSDGTLTISEPSVIPIPAAVWLMGSGLVGLLGISRRNSYGA